MTLTFRFSPCVCTVVSRLNEFSYDGIPKDGAFLTSEQTPLPGQKIFCSRQSVTVTRLSLQNLGRQRNGNFRRSFAELWLTARSLAPGPGWKAAPSPGSVGCVSASLSRVPVSRLSLRRRMSPCHHVSVCVLRADPSQT